jgi:large subunit ribosomal protein L30
MPRNASTISGTALPAKLRITWVKSAIGYSQRQKDTIRALGFHHLGDVVEHADSPVVRGMVNKVVHLVRMEQVQE